MNFLYLGFIAAAVLTLVLKPACAADVCSTADIGCNDDDDVGLLQIHPNYKAEEAILDFTLADAGALENESVAEESAKGIDQWKWSDMFHKLDSDGDGKLTAADLDKDSFVEASGDVKRLNITKAQIADALGLMASLDPKLAPFLVKHSQLAVFTAWTGKTPPAGSPEPSEDEITPVEEDDGRRMWELGYCEAAIIQTLVPTVNLLLAALAIRLPGGKLAKAILKYARRSKKFLGAVNEIVENLGGPDNVAGGGPSKLGQFIFQVGKEMWETGVLKQSLNEALKSLSVWDYISIGAPALAALAAFFVSAGTANLVAVIVAGGVSVGDLTMAIVDIGKSC